MNNIFNFDKPKTAVQWLIFLAAIGISLTSPAGTRSFTRELGKYISKKLNEGPSKIGKDNALNTKELSQALYSLKKRKLVEIKSIKGETLLVLSEKGKKRKLQYDFDKMKILKPNFWDKKWRFVMFDIPETKKVGREALRGKLKDLGFLRFQKSVWIYPYHCENEIDFIAEHFGIAPYLTFLTAQIEDDGPIRKRFEL